MNHPLLPTLYDNPVVNMDYDRWDRYHIWLHKQPLFLWQIALSLKIFGVSEFSLRIPSILLGTILVLISYRTGKILVNKRVGYITGLFQISNIYILELIAGRQELEHNDIAFLVYISLSIWSFIEYYYSKNKFWIYLIGIFSGLAILTKWLVGLLVYFGWFVLRVIQKRIRLHDNIDILISLAITLLISLPWQIISFMWYPTEALNAYRFNSVHFTSPLEGHGGDFYYYFDNFDLIYGEIASFLIIPAFIVFYRKINNLLTVSLLGMVVIVYLFFTFAATKMPSFPIVVLMIITMAYAPLFEYLVTKVYHYIKGENIKRAIFVLLIVSIVLIRFDVGLLKEKHTHYENENYYTKALSHNKEVFNSLNLTNNTVLFNVKGRHYIEAMFYLGLPAYNFLPSYEQYQDLKVKGRDIAVFIKPNTQLPAYLSNDSSVRFIQKELKGYE